MVAQRLENNPGSDVVGCTPPKALPRGKSKKHVGGKKLIDTYEKSLHGRALLCG